MKIVLKILLVFMMISGCNTKPKNESQKELVATEASIKEYKTKSGKVFIVHVDNSMGASICKVEVETQGFSARDTNYELGTLDKIEKVFLDDLDQNGFEEIYLVTRSAGSGSYSNIYGVASNKDKSATPIYVRPITEKQMGKGAMFEGFMGHNKFVLEGDKLINSYPVYLEGDTNSKPNGGEQKVQYKLIAGEAGWILEPMEITEP